MRQLHPDTPGMVPKTQKFKLDKNPSTEKRSGYRVLPVPNQEVICN